MSDLYFVFDYSEENTSDIEEFPSTLPLVNDFSLSLNRKKKCGKESQLKKAKHIHASSVDLLHIRIGNVNWCKCGHCKKEASKIDCLCCREVDLILIASARIPKREGSISPSSFYGQLPIICHNVLALST